MIASRQPARRIALDAGLHAAAGPRCFIPVFCRPACPCAIAASAYRHSQLAWPDTQHIRIWANPPHRRVPEHALQRLQSHCSAHYYPGETHAFHVMYWCEQALRGSFEFLQQHLPTEKHLA